MITVTKEFVLALKRTLQATQNHDDTLERTKEYTEAHTVGAILRNAVEQDRQAVALLTDWIQRNYAEVGLSKDEVRL